LKNAETTAPVAGCQRFSSIAHVPNTVGALHAVSCFR
jgi:hypothetical protein